MVGEGTVVMSVSRTRMAATHVHIKPSGFTHRVFYVGLHARISQQKLSDAAQVVLYCPVEGCCSVLHTRREDTSSCKKLLLGRHPIC